MGPDARPVRVLVADDHRLFAEALALREKFRITHIPYKGAGPALVDLVAGHVPFGSVTFSSAAELVRAGKVRPLAVSAERRLANFPEIPTFRELGYVVSRNKPYAGGFITEHYGNPAAGLHSIQIEINRALYMDERRYERSRTFDRLASHICLLADRLGDLPPEELKPYRAAAE